MRVYVKEVLPEVEHLNFQEECICTGESGGSSAVAIFGHSYKKRGIKEREAVMELDCLCNCSVIAN